MPRSVDPVAWPVLDVLAKVKSPTGAVVTDAAGDGGMLQRLVNRSDQVHALIASQQSLQLIDLNQGVSNHQARG